MCVAISALPMDSCVSCVANPRQFIGKMEKKRLKLQLFVRFFPFYDLLFKQPSLICFAACVADTLLSMWLRCLDQHRLEYASILCEQNDLAAHINRFYFSKELKTAFITVYSTAIPFAFLVRGCCAAATISALLLRFRGKFSIAGQKYQRY